MSTAKEELNKFKEQIDSLRKQIQETGEQFLIKNFKEIFKKHPYLTEVSWTGYTPYFNDGETCYYSSCHKDPEIEGEDCGRRTERYTNIKSDIREFMSLFDDDLMMDLFGDHVKIIVTKEGITVEDYEHE